MRKEVYPEPTAEQLQALEDYARHWGHRWKSRLNSDWMSSTYFRFDNGPVLQGIRNQFGPTWLTKFKLPKAAQPVAESTPHTSIQSVQEL